VLLRGRSLGIEVVDSEEFLFLGGSVELAGALGEAAAGDGEAFLEGAGFGFEKKAK